MGEVTEGSECVYDAGGELVRCVYDGYRGNGEYGFHKMPSAESFTVGPVVFCAKIYQLADRNRWPDEVCRRYQVMLMKENAEKLKKLKERTQLAGEKFKKLQGSSISPELTDIRSKMQEQFDEFARFMEEFTKNASNK